MSISSDEFIRMLQKDDGTLKKIREQFIKKTKINTAKIIDEEYEETDEDEEELQQNKKRK